MMNFEQETTQEIKVKVTRLRFFEGKNIDMMPVLLSGQEGVDLPRTPMTVKQLLYERAHCENEHDRDLLRNNCVDTADVIIVDPSGSGEAVIGLYSDPVVRSLVDSINSPNPYSTFVNGALPVTKAQYEAVKKNGFVISPEVAAALRGNIYACQHEREGMWEYLAEGDTELVKANLALVQEARGGDMSDRMGWYISSKVPGMRFVLVWSVGDYSSDAFGNNLDDHDGRLVGIAPEAQ